MGLQLLRMEGCVMTEKKKLKDANADAFLTELSALTAKYGIAVGSCGCCGSPYLEIVESRDGEYKHDGFSQLEWGEKE